MHGNGIGSTIYPDYFIELTLMKYRKEIQTNQGKV